MRPDKAKVVDEIWDDERIDSFLGKAPIGGAKGGENAEFSTLLNAYRSMRAKDFGRFIAKFKANGGSVDAKSEDGRTLAEFIETHAKAAPFRDLLIS